MRRQRHVLNVLAWSIIGASCAGPAAADDIVLSIEGASKAALTLSWSGGTPNYRILRGGDPATAANVENLRGVTGDLSWTESPIRPAPGQGFYYLVQETELEAGGFPEQWINGVSCPAEPSIQVHAYNPDLYILRQSLCTSFEGPFMYLLFGEDKVLMQDTGDGGIPIAATVYGIIDQWLFDRGRSSIELIVSHSHSHGDHVQGDGQFQGQPDTTVVGLSPAAVAAFFGITNWPDQVVQYDLGGGRIVDVFGIPGHQAAHIALYDRRTGLLFTGDSLYPGRLYIIDSFPAYHASIQRIVDFITDKPVVNVLGTHIEMTNTPFEDFPFGSTQHPDEHELPLGREHVLELLQGVADMADDPFVEAHADFIIFPF